MSDEMERNKLNKKQMLKLKEINDKIDELFELKSKLISRILEAKGDSIGVMKLDDEKLAKPWMRIQLIDNMMPFTEKDVVWRSTAFRRYEAKIEYLVREPKENKQPINDSKE